MSSRSATLMTYGPRRARSRARRSVASTLTWTSGAPRGSRASGRLRRSGRGDGPRHEEAQAEAQEDVAAGPGAVREEIALDSEVDGRYLGDDPDARGHVSGARPRIRA